MQTFLPFESFKNSAKVLDQKRLGKQRVETMQIMQTLCGISQGWRNHPAVKMWAGYEKSLLDYQRAVIDEWVSRGYKDNVCWDKTVAAFNQIKSSASDKVPDWLGDFDFHASHRSNLLRKNAEWYSQFQWSDSDDLDYIWPIK
jgi:hypothetical protein